MLDFFKKELYIELEINLIIGGKKCDTIIN
jgi:hypothetical protein